MLETQELQQPKIDVNKIGCRIIDVHAALQLSFEAFAESGESTLEGLAQRIQTSLSEMPVFIIGESASVQE